ncbi:hypothetical protein ACLOJK_031913 [Asimina triloba]
MATTTKFSFTEDEMEIDEGLGYPRAYARLCRNPHLFLSYDHGPPFTYLPYTLPAQESLRARDLDQIFPIIDPDRNPSVNPRNYANLLWKQLSHLGNAGFDPAKFRMDMYGNVLYFHADSASPLAWEIDHWFPCSRGGRTVPSNLRILQWQVCKRKQRKLEFLIPWWDLQLGISVNQFLTIFASNSSDFSYRIYRNRAFSWLFAEGEHEELNDLQAVASHVFPQHFIEAEQEVGLAPAAIVLSCRDSSASPLMSLDINRPLRPGSPAIGGGKIPIEEKETQCNKAIQQFRPRISEGIENHGIGHNKYTAIVVAKDSLKHREEIEKKQAEMQKLDSELNELKENNESERLTIQELESMLIKRKRRVEKSRRLAESQSSYRALLEKMIRDAMHQNVVYKEQTRLNQAANNSLMARLEAQKAICDASERELYRKFKQRDDVVEQMRPYMEHARKRSRTDDGLFEEKHEKNMKLLLLGTEKTKRKPLQKQLRLFLEEEQKASDSGIPPDEEREQEQPTIQGERKGASATKNANGARPEQDLSLIIPNDEKALDDELQKLALKDREYEDTKEMINMVTESLEREEEEEYRKKIGKGNVDKWLQMLLENGHEGRPSSGSPEIACRQRENTAQMDGKINPKHPQEELKIFELEAPKESMESDLKGAEVVDADQMEDRISQSKCNNKLQCGEKNQEKRRERNSVMFLDKKNINAEMRSIGSKSFERKDGGGEKSGKEKGLVRCESARSLRPSFPASPSMILKKGVDCIGKKPVVMGDDDDGSFDMGRNKFFKTSIKKTYTQAIKKVMNK